MDGYLLSHYYTKTACIPMEDEKKLPADQLPQGPTPLWYEASKGYSKRAILENVSQEIPDLSVTVVYQRERDSEAEKFCQEKEWSYRYWEDMVGCEDQCIIALDCLLTESISRPHNLLVLVTTPEFW